MAMLSESTTLQDWVIALTGLGLSTWVIGWAKALPVVVIVPALGLRSMPTTLKSALALALMVAVIPGMGIQNEPLSVASLTLAVFDGVTTALPAALGIWIATMAGSLYDELTGAEKSLSSGLWDSESSATGTLFGFVAAIAFLAQGGAAKLVFALSRPVAHSQLTLRHLADQLNSGVSIAIVVSGPLVIAALLITLASMLSARSLHVSAARALVLPLQGIFRLLALAVLLEWVLTALVSRH